MQNDDGTIATLARRMPWNKGKLIGAKPPLRTKHAWSIRTRLQVEGRVRDLAMFNLARRHSAKAHGHLCPTPSLLPGRTGRLPTLAMASDRIRRFGLVDMRVTRKGDARYRELSARFLAIASTVGVGLSEADIRRTSEIVRQLSDDVKAQSERLS